MALKGTLDDLGVVDLIQFPHTGRKTGQLVLADGARRAELFYRKGNLVHAFTDDDQGIEALVDVVGWTEGTFEFNLGIDTTDQSIEVDLHRAVMQALKIRDERKMEEERKQQEAVEDEVSSGILTSYLQSSSHVLYACVMNPSGRCIAQAAGEDGAPTGMDQLRGSLHALIDAYPRQGLSRVFVEDDLGTVVMSRLSEEQALVVVATKKMSLGAVSIGVGKLAQELVEASS